MSARHVLAVLASTFVAATALSGSAGAPDDASAGLDSGPMCSMLDAAIAVAPLPAGSGSEPVEHRDEVTLCGVAEPVATALLELPDLPHVPAAPSACPAGMVRVSGEYCTEVRHVCQRWLDDPKLQYARCAEYERSARCVGKRVSMDYCIDRYEYTAPGDSLPLNHQSFMTGSKICKEQGKRLCTEREWNFACEGEAMLPYPYGWSRAAKCNQDQLDLYAMATVDGKAKQVLKDRRVPSGSLPECVSPFGVHDMVGNVDEAVLREEARFNPPFRNGLKGGWWMAGRNRCRPATTAHDDYYQDIQVGVRCCADLPGETGASG